MIGKYKISIRSKKFNIDFEVKRNITVIEGYSGTGKTTMYEIVEEYIKQGKRSPITVVSELHLTTDVDTDKINNLLDTYTNVLLVVDDSDILTDNIDKLKTILNLGAYIIIITRDATMQLDFAVDEIYEMRSSGKFYRLEKLYKPKKINEDNINSVVTEDSMTGYKVVQKCFSNKFVQTSNGNSNILKYVKINNMLAIVDGACFGRYIKSVVENKNVSNTYISVPESFEYVILKTLEDKLSSSNIINRINEPYKYFDSSNILTWEQYYTILLIEVTTDTIYKYSKRKCNELYLQEPLLTKIKELILNNIVERDSPELVVELSSEELEKIKQCPHGGITKYSNSISWDSNSKVI